MPDGIKKDGIQKINDDDLNVSGGWSWPWSKKEEQADPVIPDTPSAPETPAEPVAPIVPQPTPVPTPKPKPKPKPKPRKRH